MYLRLAYSTNIHKGTSGFDKLYIGFFSNVIGSQPKFSMLMAIVLWAFLAALFAAIASVRKLSLPQAALAFTPFVLFMFVPRGIIIYRNMAIRYGFFAVLAYYFISRTWTATMQRGKRSVQGVGDGALLVVLASTASFIHAFIFDMVLISIRLSPVSGAIVYMFFLAILYSIPFYRLFVRRKGVRVQMKSAS